MRGARLLGRVRARARARARAKVRAGVTVRAVGPQLGEGEVAHVAAHEARGPTAWFRVGVGVGVGLGSW